LFNDLKLELSSQHIESKAWVDMLSRDWYTFTFYSWNNSSEGE